MATPKPSRRSSGLTVGAGGSSKFQEQFNRLVGNRTGRPVGARPASTPARRSQTKQRLRKGQRSRGASISMGTSKLPKNVERSREAWFGDRGDPSGGVGFERAIKSNLEQIYDDLTEKFNRYQNEQQQVQQEVLARDQGIPASDKLETIPNPNAEVPDNSMAQWNAEHPEDQIEFAPPISETWYGTPVGIIAEGLNRPFNAIQEGMRNTLEEGYKRRDAGGNENDWGHIFGDLASGAWEGLSGQRQTGAGDVYELWKNESEMAPASSLRELEKSDPWMEDIISKGVGFTGEMTMDPLDKFGIGRANVVRGTRGNATEATMREATNRMATDAAEEFYDNVIQTRYSNRINNPNMFFPDRDAFVERAQYEAADKLANSELAIHGGGRKNHYQVQNGPAWAGTVSNAVMDSQRELLFRNFNTHVGNFRNFVMSGRRMSTPAVQAYMAVDEDFARFIDDLDTELVARGRLAPNSSLDDVLDAVGRNDKTRINNIADNIRAELDGDLNKVGNDVYSVARNATYPTLTIRVGSKSIPVKAIGRGYHAVKSRVKKESDEVSERSYEKLMPATLSLKAQKQRSVGVEAFEKFQKEVSTIARRYTKDESELIHRSIENGTDLSYSPHLQEGKEFIQKAYKDIWDEEVALGARPDMDSSVMGSAFLNNYVFVYNQKGHLTVRKKFKDERKTTVHNSRTSPNGTSRGRYGTEHAAQQGLKPVTNGFHALMYRKLKSQRDVTKALYRTDLVENYGFWSEKVHEFAQANRKITRMPEHKLPHHMRQQVKKDGGAYYLPYYHADVIAKFDELMSWNSASMGKFMREWNKFINVIKTMQTIPNPGFHINNMIGDGFMGLMDGVKGRDYVEVSRKFAAAKAGRVPMYKIAPGVEYSHQELWSMYKADASGGYFRVDQAGFVKPSVKGAPRQVIRKTADAVMDAAEFRENFGRFTHYVHALRDEATIRSRKGMIGDLALQQARDAALWRVNYYKFDYNALTLWERKLKTMAIPFYTYTRKVIPVLLASMFENPKYINALNRFFAYNDGSAADDFSNWNVPSYLRMGGAAFLTDEAEPWTLNRSGTPLGKLNMLQGGEAGTWNPADDDFLSGWANELTTQLNPVAQLPFELSMGRENFTQDIINRGEGNNFLLNKIPMVKDILTEGNQVPGIQKLIPDIGSEEEPFDWKDMISNRLTGLGIQAKPLSRGSQSLAHNEWMDQLIDDPLYKVNNSQDLFQITPSNSGQPGAGITYQVRSAQELDSGGMPAVVREFGTAREAIEFVKKNIPPGYQKPSEFLELGPEGTARYVDDSAWRVGQP